MSLDTARTRKLLNDFDLTKLFIEELGWDRLSIGQTVRVDGTNYGMTPIAEKRGVQILECSSDSLLPYAIRQKIDRQVRKLAHEHLIIFTDQAKTTQVWQWVSRQQGKPTAYREYQFHKGHSADALIVRLKGIYFPLSEEEGLDITGVTTRLKDSLDREQVTKKFYDYFKEEHDAFQEFLRGIPIEEDQRWYASVMLNRLMFIYFIQSKGFLNNDHDYLRNKLAESKKRGNDRFYRDFLCPLFFEGFAEPESNRSAKINVLLGSVPYLNGGIFQEHQLEKAHGKDIKLPDKAFHRLFEFFDRYRWQLDERPLRNQNEINPDILGYIFEKYINQKQMGAYYTKEDITEYISKNTIIPYLFDAARPKCRIAFEGEHSIWRLLKSDPDRYIYPAILKGVTLPLPDDIAAGIGDVLKRTGWNRPASEEYALSTEIWREVVARRQRYEEVKAKLAAGEIRNINELITYNLNVRQFAQDVIQECEGPELLRAFWKAIEKVTVLDPTCGSGAFLFAALNILEPLYEACLDRMQIFVDELDRAGEKHNPEKFSDFRGILARIDEHPNRRYFILKSIIIKNLYGVDIMEEAVEICKLRLFLKLVAQIEPTDKIEPLPDIDFNIRVGNTLVGYANLAEAKKAVTAKLDFDDTWGSIETKAKDLECLSDQFRTLQLDADGSISSDRKQELERRLAALNNELNGYLVKEYGIDRNKNRDFTAWLYSHRPFNWFVEFHRIMQSGGFDVALGNPPYVEYNSAIKSQYTIRGFSTEPCGNLYAFMLERSLQLTSTGSYAGFIVPVSSIGSSMEYEPLRKLIFNGQGWFSSYAGDTNPGVLFEGVKRQLAIHILHRTAERRLLFSKYYRWYAAEREHLFSLISYTPADSSLKRRTYPKLSDAMHAALTAKILSKPTTQEAFRAGSGTMYYHRAFIYWLKSYSFKPYFHNERDGSDISKHQMRVVACADQESTAIIVAVTNSTTYYLFTLSYSDCRNIRKDDLVEFPLGLQLLEKHTRSQLAQASDELMRDLRTNAVRRKIGSSKTGEVEYQEFYVKKSKTIIDTIDRLLAKHYGFSDEETDFIVNYDVKYRLGINWD